MFSSFHLRRLSLSVLFLVLLSSLAFSASAVIDRATVDAARDAWLAGTATATQLELLTAVGYAFPGSDDPGEPVIDETGGPDDWGYTYKDSYEPDVDFTWEEITATGTLINTYDASPGDQLGPFPIGFDFEFYGETYSEFYLSTWGFMQFEPGSANWYPESLPINEAGPAFMTYWTLIDPTYPTNNGNVYYQTVTLDDQAALVVQWDNIMEFPGTWDNQDRVSFEMILLADGTLIASYGGVVGQFYPPVEITGIQNGAGIALENTSGPLPGGQSCVYEFQGTGATVTGTVSDAFSDEPIYEATVTIDGQSAVTYVDGTYTLPGTFNQGQDYTWTATAPGFEPASGTISMVSGENVLDIGMTPELTGVDVLVWAGDLTPGNVYETRDNLESLGYSTQLVTEYDMVDWSQFEFVFACVGIYPNNYVVSTNSPAETVMVDYLNQGGTLFMEGGDLFGYDQPANLTAMLNLGIVDDGPSGMTTLEGATGTWMEPMLQFDYLGESLYIDHFQPVNGAEPLMHDADNGLLVGVIDRSVPEYNTAVFSFETGALPGDFPFTFVLYEGLFQYWAETVDPEPFELTLTPVGNTDLPGDGGTLDFQVHFVSNMDVFYPNRVFWTQVQLPNGNLYPQILFVQTFNIPPYLNITATLNQTIPAFAPAGSYLLWGNVSRNMSGNYLTVSDSFEFSKAEPLIAGDLRQDEPGTGWSSTVVRWTTASQTR